MKNNQKGFANVVVIGVLVVLVALVSYFAWSKKSQEINTNQDSNNTTSISSDWKTYKNDKYEFEFNYPKELYLADNYHGEEGLITLSDQKDWETKGQNALLVISLN